MINDETLFFGLPISFSESVKLYQPKLKEMLAVNLTFAEIIEPFVTLDKGHFEGETNNNLMDFDYFFIQIIIGYMDVLEKGNEEINILDWVKSENSDTLVVKRLVRVLKFLFKSEDIQIHISENIIDKMDKNYILINKSYKIDRDTYPILKKAVCEIFDTEIKIEKKEKVSEELSELDRIFKERAESFEKIHGKKKEKNKDNITIMTIINYIIHSRFSQFTYDTIQNLTIYQIKNTFKYYQSQEVYEVDMQYRTSGQFKMKENGEHWFFDN